MRNFDTTLYFITDSTGFSEEEFLRRTEEALKGGASLLQLREKDKTTREYISLAEKVQKNIMFRLSLTTEWMLRLPWAQKVFISDKAICQSTQHEKCSVMILL